MTSVQTGWSLIILTWLLIGNTEAGCPAGWETRENYCYYFDVTLKTWSSAESFCQLSGGHLISFADVQERDWSYTNHIGPAGGKWWIGLNDILNEGDWVWNDGTLLNANVPLWRPGEPNNSGTDQHCVAYEGGNDVTQNTWNDETCSHKRSYACKTPFDEEEVCDTNNGFEQQGSNCFVFVDQKMNWHDANDYCMNNWNAYLTSIISAEEQGYLAAVGAQHNVDLWIGLSDSATPGTLVWSNGYDKLSYQTWVSGEPAGDVGSTCVKSVKKSNGAWSTARCSTELSFMCKKGIKKTCPDGWTYGNGKCYNFYLNENLFLTWTEARDFCNSQNSKLLKVESPEEHQFISGFYSQWKRLGVLQMWLGISDILTDNVLTWSDGTAISNYTQWDVDPSQAMCAGVDDCAWIYTGKNSGNWEIGNCFILQSFACEVPEGTFLSPFPKPIINYKCDDGWRLYADHCYLFNEEKRSWDASDAFCRQPEQGFGYLASIHDEGEQSFMSGHLRGQSWIGMTDRITEGTWLWSDGTPSDFFNWKFEQPNQDGDCMRIIGVDDENAWGGWNDRACTELVYTICKNNAVSTQPHSPSVDTDPNEAICGTGYYHNPGTHKCYKIVTDYKRQWADARLHCQQDGGDLISINSPEEQAFIEFHLAYASVASVWTGGLDSFNGPDFLPEITDAFDGGWRWIDETPFNFVNWNSGEPNNSGDEDCVEIRTSDGLWNDIPCTYSYGYVCEKDDPDHEEDPPADCTTEDCCFRHLGVEIGGSIKNNQLSASSQLDTKSGADRGRLNMLDGYIDLIDIGPGRGAWIADENDPAPWFKVDLRDWTEVRGIVTQGRNGVNQPNNQNNWVKQYSVQYMVNPARGVFENYKELDGTIKIYDANYDQDDQITNIFTRPIVTTAIKILPTECRKKCAMRVELLGCSPTCVSSLGLSTDFEASDFPILDNSMFSASTQQSGYEAYNARLDYSGGDAESIEHYLLDDATLTYDTARAYCVSNGADLCSRDEICPNGLPVIIGVLSGDKWSPIRDGYNDWVEIGDDNSPQNPGRVCWKHNDHYAAPDWGITAGECPPWNTYQSCDHKGHVFCCPVNSKSWKPTVNNKNQWIQVDFGDYRKISGVLVQGDLNSDSWITDYYISFSDDGQKFSTYKTPSGDLEMFPGCTDRNTPVEGYLREPITARYLRILPQAWNNNIALRMDVIGCNVGARADCADTAVSYEKDSFVVDCPAGCDTVDYKLWGTGIYTDDSYVCSAAIHDGRIIAEHGGTVSVKMIAGQSSYKGSSQHGVTSLDYGTWPGSFSLQGDHLGCRTGWQGWKDWCYYLSRKTAAIDHSSARQRCQSYGGELVSIHSQAEQDFVTDLVFVNGFSIDDVWIGMTDLEQTNYFKWEDGSDVTYTRWDYNEPNGGESEHCVHLYKFSGLWNDKSCSAVMNYMCKMDKVPVNQNQVDVDGCPTGWVGWEASCYLFDVSPSVWTNAEDFCSDKGGHLATISSYYEQMFITGQASQTSHPDDQENFYIGLGAFVDPNGALSYRWSSGEPITFTAWGKDEPLIWHQCVFPFQYNGVEYYDCISEGRPFQLLGGPWCSADAIYTNHPVPCQGMDNGQVGCIVLDKDNGYWSQANPIGCGSPEYRICEIPRTGYTTPAVPTPPSPNGNCPTGWYGNATSTFCYQINEMTDATQKLSWENAKRHCESQGSNLASIHSPQEESVIGNGVTGVDEFTFWIGLKRQEDGQLGWSDKTPLSYTNWDTSEPNNHNGRENCVEARFEPGNYNWNDLNCDAARNWICKVERGKDLLPPITVPTGTLSPAICGSDVAWVAYTSSYTDIQKCYYFASTPVQSWHQSNTYCKSLGGTLVSIATLDEQEFITGRTSKTGIDELWIGLVQDTMSGPYIWVDGTPLTFENWHGNGQPDDNFGQELCVNLAASLGLWSDANCGLSKGFICQKYPGARPVTPDPTPVVPGGCPYNWWPYGSKCFLEVGFTDTSLRDTWENSEAYCENIKGNLASVPNEYYSAYLTSQLFASSANIWIGLNSRGTDLTFKWSDNEEVLFTNWASGEPNNADGAEECVELIWTSDRPGQWNDHKCSQIRPFYCIRTKDIDFSPDYQGDVPNTCPPGHDFVNWDTGCYKLYSSQSDRMTWEQARDKCRSDGNSWGYKMDLASVWNVYENSFLMSLFWPQPQEVFDEMWIGLYYEYNVTNGDNEFKWSDQSPMAFTQWGLNEPNTPVGTQGCVIMSKYGTWGMTSINGTGVACSQTKLPFVCKYETLTIPEQDPGVGICEPGWAGLGDYCYLVVPGHNSLDLRTWGDADRECQTKMGYLTSIHSEIENKALIGWTDQKNVWIGLKRNGWGAWDWNDKTPVDFTKWADDEPNDSGETGEACAELYTNARWNDQSCTETRGYICKKHKTYSTCAFPDNERDDCGYPGITNYECVTRGCCWDEAGLGPHACYYSRADAACIEKGGSCKDYRYNVCELGYETSLCSGGMENKCCFACDANDATCTSEVNSWETGDNLCESGGYGVCQYDSNYCGSGLYESGKCGGPSERRCCVVHPITLPPELSTTTEKGHTPPPKTTTKPGQTIKTTTPNKPTDGPTINDIGGGGLDGGGIAGIVIAVIIVVCAAGVGIYFCKRGDVKVPFTTLSSNQSSVSGFDNPIAYSKNNEAEGDEYDA